VTWPDGVSGSALEVGANSLYEIERDADEAQPWVAPQE
jgi:hypothetical protein